MPRLLAIEWDLREARVAVARSGGTNLVIEQAFSVDLGPRDAGTTFADVNVGQKVAAALAARNVGRAETLVAVGRASIELRQLALPTCPLEELPDMVRFQAMQEFTTLAADWPLDFVHLAGSEDGNLSVLAAAISPTMVTQIQETCQSAEVIPRRLILRPLAAASLLRRRDGHSASECRLMVDLLADEADLTILVDEHVALMRTVRLASSSDPQAQSRALLGEIRRTIASAQNQLAGRRVEKVVLCGDGSDQDALKQTIEAELSLTVDLFDPFDSSHVDAKSLPSRPEHTGRFTPLLGMLVDEALASPHAIDFLHPRKRPVPPNTIRRNVFVSATVVAACLVAILWTIISLRGLDAAVALKRSQSAELKKEVAEAQVTVKHRETVQEFLDSDITWLDELYELSDQLPPPEEVIVTQLNFATRSPSGAQMTIGGSTKEPDQLTVVRNSLGYGGRRVVSEGTQDDSRQKDYRWLFKETVLIEAGSQRQPPTIEKDDPPPQTASADVAAEKESTNR